MCLALAVPFVAALIVPVCQGKLPRVPALYLGILLIVAAYVFTLAEHIALNAVFNLLEHTCYMLAGLAFAAATYRLARISRSEGKGG